MVQNKEENKLLAICQFLPIGFLFFDRGNKLSLINPQAEKFLNIRAEKIIGKSISELTKFSKLKPLLNVFFKKRIKKISRKELQIGENLILEVSSSPILKEGKTLRQTQGKKIGTLVVLDDISREKAAERIKTQFISLAAHQFRTPLSAIKWGLKMLLDGEIGELPKEQKNFLKKIYHSNERMITSVKDLSLIARIEEGKYLLEPAGVQMERVVKSVIDSYRRKIKKKKIRLKLKKPEKKLPKVFADVKKLKLAIGNLLENSLSYTEFGGKIIISLKGRKKKIKFEIQDNGIGIPKNQQKKVFQKFFRGSNVIRIGTEGTGLGLFVTKNIIEAHGGKIWFESRENTGTNFHFTLPIETV